MSHGIKLFPTVSGRQSFGASNESWGAEVGASIYADANSIAAQSELHIVASTTLAGAVSPAVTLVGSLTPVRGGSIQNRAPGFSWFCFRVTTQPYPETVGIKC